MSSLPDRRTTRQDKTRQDKTRQDKTRQDKTRQDKTTPIILYHVNRVSANALLIFKASLLYASKSARWLKSALTKFLLIWLLLGSTLAYGQAFLSAAPTCPNSSTINETCINTPDHLLSNITFGPQANIKGGKLTGTIINQGWLSNITILPGATVSGGTLTGYIENQGTVSNITFRGAMLTGGKLAGTIINKSVLKDVTILPDTMVKGGRLLGTIVNQGTLQNVWTPCAEVVTIKGGTIAGKLTSYYKYRAQLEETTVAANTVLTNVKLGNNVKMDPSVIVKVDPTLVESGVNQIRYAKSRKETTPTVVSDNTDRFITGRLGLTVVGATVETYDGDGNLLSKQEKATDKFGRYNIGLAEEDSQAAYLKVYDGTIGNQSFEGVMEGLCSQTVPKICQVTSYSGLILRLSSLYSNTDSSARQQAAQQLVGEVIGLREDPFLAQYPDVSKVNVLLWQSVIGDGAGLAFMLDSLSSDMVDGYIDEPANYPFLLATKQRTTVTETVAIDQTKLQQQLSGAHLATPGTLKVVSFANDGESQVDNGQSVVSHENYLSGYAAVAEYPTGDPEDPVVTDILYYGFNLGKWKGLLNAETTTLFHVFLQAPGLAFLPDSEKLKIAEFIASKDEFAQAVELYEAELQLSDDASPKTREFLLATLADEATNLTLSSSQQRGTRSLLYSQMMADSATQPTMRGRLLRSAEDTISVRPNESDKQRWFTAFDGMQIVPRDITIPGLSTGVADPLALEFYSKVSLWYAIQKKDDFFNPTTSWMSHLFDPSLIYPKAGFIDIKTLMGFTDLESLDSSAIRTRMNIANVDPELTKNAGEVEMVFFRNNPNSWVDAPQLMNIASAIQVGLKALVGVQVIKPVAKGFEKLNGIGKSLENTLELAGKVRPILEASLALAKLVCDADFVKDFNILFADKESVLVTDCNQRFGNLDQFQETVGDILAFLPQVAPGSDAAKDREKRETLWAYFKSQDFRNGDFKTKFVNLANIVVIPTDTLLASLIEVSLVRIVISPALKTMNKGLFCNGGDELKESDIAEAILRHYLPKISRTPSTARDKDIVGCVKVAMLKAKIDAGSLLQYYQNLLGSITSLANLIHNVKNLYQSLGGISPDGVLVNASQIVHLMLLELWRAGVEEVNASLPSVIGDALASLTPAKVVQMISAANQGGAMVWDWITKPNIVIVKMKRLDTQGQMQFSHYVPKLEAVRYLSVSGEFGNYILGTYGLPGLPKYTDNQVLYPTGNDAKSSNNFLVISGFTASVENHAVVKPEDKEPLNGIISLGHSSVDWHSYRYGSLPETTLPTLEMPPTNRSVDNAFLGKDCTNSGYVNWFEDINYCNYWKEVLSNKWFGNTYNTYQIGGVDSANPILYLFLKQNQRADNYYLDKDGNLNYLDFTKIYGKGLLTHKTPGVYRDTTVFKVCSAPDKCDEYDNTFNMYVLPNYLEPLLQVGVATANLNSSLKARSRVDGRMLKLRLYRPCPQASNTYWDTAKFFEDPPCTKMPLSPEMTTKRYRGLKDMPFYVMTKTTIDGRTYWRGPYEKRLGDEEYALVSSPLYWMPHTTRVYVYDAIMEAWQREVGNNIKTVFDEYDRYLTGKVVSANGENKNVQPFMAFNLDELNLALVKVYDSVNGKGVEKVGVTVVKGNSPEGESFASGQTNLEGVVEISPQQRPPDGQYTVTVCKNSYACVSKTVTIDALNQPPVEFYLTPEGTIKECNTVVESGDIEAETHIIELAKSAGTLQFDYETYSAKDRIAVEYEGKVLFDSECVGTNGWQSKVLSYEGNSTQIKVIVSPACAGDSGTEWNFKVECPSSPPPLAPDLSSSTGP